MSESYLSPGPSREEVNERRGPALLEFGVDWCGHCQAAAPAVAQALADFPQVDHVKVEDGPGRPLGRSFRVKLWPTLVFLRDGVEVARLVRPEEAEPIRKALRQIA
jgi:thioredoxin 1